MELLPDSQTNSNNDEKTQYALHILAVPYLINSFFLCITWNGVPDFFPPPADLSIKRLFFTNAYTAFTLKLCTNIFSRINTHKFAEEAYQYLD